LKSTGRKLTEAGLFEAEAAACSNAATVLNASGPTAITFRKGANADLAEVNELIAAAMDTWQLSARVKRTSLPLYRYQTHDLEYLQIVVAATVKPGIVGVAAIEPVDKADAAGCSDWSLHGLYVMPDQHRRGIASRLLERIETMAAAENVRGLLAKARPEAVPFFESRGFVRLTVEDHSRDYPYRFYKSL
jgi:GNAT superfamily N-acetyltransferase